MRDAVSKPLSILLFHRANVLTRRLASPVFCALLGVGVPAPADIIDRIAVSVGNSVITASALDREIRVTALLNGGTPDFSPAARRATADRLVEQKLIQREMELSRYPVPEASAAEPLFASFRKRYSTDAAFQRALAQAGVTEQDVRERLVWQLTLLRFIDVRFRPAVQVTDQDIQNYFETKVKPAAEAAHPGQPVSVEDYAERIRETLAGQRADQELDNWLKEALKRTEIVYHEEAFR